VKSCLKCNSLHYISYATHATSALKYFLPKAHIGKYFHVTNETIFETDLLKSLMADLLFKHTSFRGFADAYNFLYANDYNKRQLLNRIRLTDAFYASEIVKFYHEHHMDKVLIS
jgi:hypothetical protein